MTRCVRGHYRRAAQQVTISFMNPSLSPFRSPDVRAFTFSERILGLFSSSYAFFVFLRFLSLSFSFSSIFGSHAWAEDILTMSSRRSSFCKREKYPENRG